MHSALFAFAWEAALSNIIRDKYKPKRINYPSRCFNERWTQPISFALLTIEEGWRRTFLTILPMMPKPSTQGCITTWFEVSALLQPDCTYCFLRDTNNIKYAEAHGRQTNTVHPSQLVMACKQRSAGRMDAKLKQCWYPTSKQKQHAKSNWSLLQFAKYVQFRFRALLTPKQDPK